MEIQQAEREDSTFSHRCLFCREVFTGNRVLLFQHMLEDHSFNVGQPDNLGMNFNETTQLMMIILLLLVFVVEFLDMLQNKLDRYNYVLFLSIIATCTYHQILYLCLFIV